MQISKLTKKSSILLTLALIALLFLSGDFVPSFFTSVLDFDKTEVEDEATLDDLKYNYILETYIKTGDYRNLEALSEGVYYLNEADFADFAESIKPEQDLDDTEQEKVEEQEVLDNQDAQPKEEVLDGKSIELVSNMLELVEEDSDKYFLEFILNELKEGKELSDTDKFFVYEKKQFLKIKELIDKTENPDDVGRLEDLLGGFLKSKKLNDSDREYLKNLQHYYNFLDDADLAEELGKVEEFQLLAEKIMNGDKLEKDAKAFRKRLNRLKVSKSLLKEETDTKRRADLRSLNKRIILDEELLEEENEALDLLVEEQVKKLEIEEFVDLEVLQEERELQKNKEDFEQQIEEEEDSTVDVESSEEIADQAREIKEKSDEESENELEEEDNEEEIELELNEEELEEVEEVEELKGADLDEEEQIEHEQENPESPLNIKEVDAEEEVKADVQTEIDPKSLIGLDNFNAEVLELENYLVLNFVLKNELSLSNLKLNNIWLEDLNSTRHDPDFMIAQNSQILVVFDLRRIHIDAQIVSLKVVDKSEKYLMNGFIDLNSKQEQIEVKKYDPNAERIKKKKASDRYDKFLKNVDVGYKLIREKYLKGKNLKELSKINRGVYLVGRFTRDLAEHDFVLDYIKRDKKSIRLVFSHSIYPYNIALADFVFNKEGERKTFKPFRIFISGPQIVLTFKEKDFADFEKLNMGAIRNSEGKSIVGEFILDDYLQKERKQSSLDLSSSVEESELDQRDFTPEEKAEQVLRNNFKEAIKNKFVSFLEEYFLSDSYLDEFEIINSSVYYFDATLLDYDPDLDDFLGQESSLIEDSLAVITKNSFWLENVQNQALVLNFSEEIDYENIDLKSFVVEDENEVTYSPKTILVADKEVVLLFDSKGAELANFLRINSVWAKNNSYQLDGYFSLSELSDRYVSIASDVDNKYEAYLEDDIVFSSSKLSFGKLHDRLETDSTIAVELGNASHLDNKCAILVFGNDLEHDSADDVIPAQGLTLVSKSEGDSPIDAKVISDFEIEKSKGFLGFVYFKDLEIIEEKHVVYLNLSAPAGLARGRYQAVMSFEIFCPSS